MFLEVNHYFIIILSLLYKTTCRLPSVQSYMSVWHYFSAAV